MKDGLLKVLHMNIQSNPNLMLINEDLVFFVNKRFLKIIQNLVQQSNIFEVKNWLLMS